MKNIDISKKITYRDALLMHFRISPLYTVLYWCDAVVRLALAPFDVVAAAAFVDSALSAATTDDWQPALLWLLLILLIKVYYYVSEPILQIIAKKRGELEWEAVDYPAVKLRASLKLQYAENSEICDLIDRTGAPAAKLCAVQSHLVELLIFVGKIAGCAVILLINAPLIGGFILLCALPMVLLAKRCAGAQYKIKQDITASERYAGSFRDYLSNRECTAERSLFSYFDYVNEKFKTAYYKSRRAVLGAEISWGVRKGLAGVLLCALCAASILLLFPSVAAGTVSVGLYISLIRAIFSGAEDIAYNLSEYLERIMEDVNFLAEFASYVELERTPDALVSLSKDAPAFETLVFSHVSFTYPGCEQPVLTDVSFTIEAGKHYSLIGVNGSGKSTIIKLILKLYDSYSGEIFLNGIPLSDWSLSDVKTMMSAVFQDFAHFEIPLCDNIRIGSGFMASDAEIDRAIHEASLDGLCSELPQGKETPIGKIYENGTELSGGQWQKIAIARMAVSRSTLKIFDEPTAALDPIAERNVYDRYSELCRGAATIFISHRLASCIHADEIFLLDNGTISERGTHAELMALGGKYREMFDSQREWYI